jgi:DNA polymerase elongation subunit (family B)
LNPGCRFFDKRIGQSTTLTGRAIAHHMDAYVNECVTGRYDHTGEAIIYGDTDSCYFSAWPAVREEVESGGMVVVKGDCRGSV